jgi:hypothetical protein
MLPLVGTHSWVESRRTTDFSDRRSMTPDLPNVTDVVDATNGGSLQGVVRQDLLDIGFAHDRTNCGQPMRSRLLGARRLNDQAQ